MTDEGSVLLGSLLCLIGSILANMANILLVCQTNVNNIREENNESPLPTCNFYIVMYILSWIASIAADTTSQLLITQQLWAALSCLDALWYLSFSVVFLNHPFSTIEFIPLFIVVGGIFLTSRYGTKEYEGHIVGITRMLEQYDLLGVCVFIPLFLIMTTLAYVYLYRQMREVEDNPDMYPIGYVPKPFHSYSLAAIYANGASSA